MFTHKSHARVSKRWVQLDQLFRIFDMFTALGFVSREVLLLNLQFRPYHLTEGRVVLGDFALNKDAPCQGLCWEILL